VTKVLLAFEISLLLRRHYPILGFGKQFSTILFRIRYIIFKSRRYAHMSSDGLLLFMSDSQPDSMERRTFLYINNKPMILKCGKT